MTTNGNGVSFWGDETVLKLIVGVTAQLCEYAKNHSIVHFKMGMVNELINKLLF